MTLPETPPTRAEVEDQVARILASKRFATARRQSSFLELVVRRALVNKKTSGKVIAQTLFRDTFIKDESSDVRVTASNLRRALGHYYEREGQNDVVQISVPKPPKDKSIKLKAGEAYTPTFSYNSNFWLASGLKLGYIHLDRWSYWNHVSAFEIFSELLKDAPNHLGPTLGLVETMCKFEYRDWRNPRESDCFSTCNALLDQLIAPPKDYWRLWAARGFVYYVARDVKTARPYFERALRLDRGQTENYPPYISFLRLDGYAEAALVLANNYAASRLNDSTALALLGQFLIEMGRIQPGVNHLEQTLSIDPGNCQAHELLATIWLWQKDLTRARGHLKMLRMLYDDASYNVTIAQLSKFDEHGIADSLAKLFQDEASGLALEFPKP